MIDQPPLDARVRPPRSDRIAIDLLIGLAAAILAFTIWATWMSLAQKLVDGLYLFTLPLGTNPREIAFPQPPDATIERAVQSNDVTVHLRHVEPTLAGLVVLQHVLTLALTLVILGALVTLLLRLRAGKPFVRSMTVILGITAIALLVLGTAVEILANIVNDVAREVITGGSPDTPLGTAWGWSISGVWILVALALAVVVGAFQIGERMDRDRMRLQHETEGLV